MASMSGKLVQVEEENHLHHALTSNGYDKTTILASSRVMPLRK